MQPYANNPALRGNLESQVNFLTELTQKTYDSIRKVSELNLHLAQQMMEDTMNMSRSMMSCTDPFQMTSAAMNQLQPATEHLRIYQQQLMGLLAGAQTEFARSTETGISEASRSASSMADQMVRHAASAASQGLDGVGAAHNPT
ncbi:MAG: phasin family protein [Massilia sp.]